MKIQKLKSKLANLPVPPVVQDQEPDFMSYAHEQMMTEEHKRESDKLTEAMLRDIGAL